MNATLNTVIKISSFPCYTFGFSGQIISMKLYRVDLLSMNPNQCIDVLFKFPNIILYACNLRKETTSALLQREELSKRRFSPLGRMHH